MAAKHGGAVALASVRGALDGSEASVGGGSKRGGDPTSTWPGGVRGLCRAERESLAGWRLINHVWTADKEMASVLDNVYACLCVFFFFFVSILKLHK